MTLIVKLAIVSAHEFTTPAPRILDVCGTWWWGIQSARAYSCLPASLAPFGLNSVIAWGFTASGAIALAIVFARLSRAFPQAGGPYAYVHVAFGPLIAFVVAWGYWISIWVGNVSIATAAVSYAQPLCCHGSRKNRAHRPL